MRPVASQRRFPNAALSVSFFGWGDPVHELIWGETIKARSQKSFRPSFHCVGEPIAAFCREPVFLKAAGGFVWDGAFQPPRRH